jgi:hypothetical protein
MVGLLGEVVPSSDLKPYCDPAQSCRNAETIFVSIGSDPAIQIPGRRHALVSLISSLAAEL